MTICLIGQSAPFLKGIYGILSSIDLAQTWHEGAIDGSIWPNQMAGVCLDFSRSWQNSKFIFQVEFFFIRLYEKYPILNTTLCIIVHLHLTIDLLLTG